MEFNLSGDMVEAVQRFPGIMTSRNYPHRIKVLHLITSLEVGGAQRGLLLGLARFDQEKYEHVICSLMDRVQMRNQFLQTGIKVKSLGLNKKTDMVALLRLRSLIKEVRPDILHTYLLHSNIIGRIVGRLSDVPVIIGSERTIGQVGSLGRLLTKLTNPLTDLVEVNSHTGAKAIIKDLGVPLNKIAVIPSGLDTDKYSVSSDRSRIRSSLGLSDKQHLVLYIGRLRPVKGVDRGLKGFKKVLEKHPTAHLALAGEGEQSRALQSLASELGIYDNVTFLGVRNDLPEILSASDSVLIPSRNEGLPRVAIEAMAAGKPVIATEVGGTPEAIIDGVTGILVMPNDINQMGNAISHLIENVKLQKRLGAAGRKRAIQHYSVEKYISRLDCLYRRLSANFEPEVTVNTNEDACT